MSKSNDWTVLQMLEWATDYFQQKNIPSPRLSIEWLLSHILKVKRLQLYLQFDKPLTSEELTLLRELVKRRAKHEPLQYITGSTSFYNAEILVNPSVLIPRPETEELVELVLNDHSGDSLNVLDIGTGSGCIPIALKMERPDWKVTTIDISTEALQTAQKNAAINQVEITLIHGDLFDPKLLSGSSFDIIISNPPYIHPEEALEMDIQVKDFEPSTALFCESRTKVYDAIIQTSARLLNPGGSLYLELHHDHAIEEEIDLQASGWDYEILKDLGRSRRFLKAKLNS